MAEQERAADADLQKILDGINAVCAGYPVVQLTSEQIAEIVLLVGEVQQLRRQVVERPNG